MTIPSRAPKDYQCPICLGLQGSDSDKTLIKPADIVYRDELVTALVNTFFMGKNAGAVIVVPNQHIESLYTLPSDISGRILDVARRVALAMKSAYNCDGIKLIQNNEPAADQHAFHFHLHVIPRYDNDGFNSILPADKRLAEPDERAGYASKLKAAL